MRFGCEGDGLSEIRGIVILKCRLGGGRYRKARAIFDWSRDNTKQRNGRRNS
jgi:hypothetical protein